MSGLLQKSYSFVKLQTGIPSYLKHLLANHASLPINHPMCQCKFCLYKFFLKGKARRKHAMLIENVTINRNLYSLGEYKQNPLLVLIS
jgi:hypothetical protein